VGEACTVSRRLDDASAAPTGLRIDTNVYDVAAAKLITAEGSTSCLMVMIQGELSLQDFHTFFHLAFRFYGVDHW
jgi:hypothetical protein